MYTFYSVFSFIELWVSLEKGDNLSRLLRNDSHAPFYQMEVAGCGFIANIGSPLQIIDSPGRIAVDIAGIAQSVVAARVVGYCFEHGLCLSRITVVKQADGPIDDNGHTVGGIVVINAYIPGITQLGQCLATKSPIGLSAIKATQGPFSFNWIGDGIDELQEVGTVAPR